MSRDRDVVQVDLTEFISEKKNSSQSWVLVDKTGQKTELDLDKYEIIHRFQIQARDVRLLDPNLSYPCTILGRQKAIVLNLEHVKAIISAEEVLFRGPSAPDVIPIVEELQRRLGLGAEYDGKKDESPFEFRVLEVALEAICSFLHAWKTDLETIYPVLDKLTSKISTSNLDMIREMKSALTRLTARVQKIKDELEHLLDDDEDMANLYLSRKLAGVSSSASVPGVPKRHATFKKTGSKIDRAKRENKNDIEELEMLLETHFMQIDRTLNGLTTLREYIDDTEDYIYIQLDNVRNQLIKFELILSCGGLCIAVYSLVVGTLGMNIPFSWNTKAYMFKWVVSVTGTLSALLFVLIMSWARYKRLVGV